MNALERCTIVARWLRPYSRLVSVVAAGALVSLLAAIFTVSGETGQFLSLASITLLLWALTLGAFVRAFSSPVDSPGPDAGLLTRLRAAVGRLYRRLLVVLIAMLLVLVVWFSIRTVLLISATPAPERVTDGARPGLFRPIQANTQKP